MWILKMFFRIYQALGGPVPTSAEDFFSLALQAITQGLPGTTP
jgi:hypothetical protein